MGSLEKAPRETQVAAKSFVPTNACLCMERLQDQQLGASGVPEGINEQGLRWIGQPMLTTEPQDRTSWWFCLFNGAANILQLQISRACLRGTSENVIVVFQSCLTTWAEPDRGIVGLCELEFVGSDGLPILSDGVRDYTSQSMTMLSPSICVWRSDSGGDRIHRYAREWRPRTGP
jgi:hypothetical protein